MRLSTQLSYSTRRVAELYIDLETLLAVCAAFTAVCVAGGWLIKIIKAAKKPSTDIKEKLENDDKRIKNLEADMDYLVKAISLLMRCDLAIVGHLQTNNNTGQMQKVESDIQEFLIER